jgi:hypothetical protein
VRASAAVGGIGWIVVQISLASALAPDRVPGRVRRADQLGGTTGIQVVGARSGGTIGRGRDDTHRDVEPIHDGHIVKVKTPVTLKRPFCQSCRRRTSSAVGITLEPAVTAAVEAASWPIVRGKVTVPATPYPARFPVIRDCKLSGGRGGRLPSRWELRHVLCDCEVCVDCRPGSSSKKGQNASVRSARG